MSHSEEKTDSSHMFSFTLSHLMRWTSWEKVRPHLTVIGMKRMRSRPQILPGSEERYGDLRI